MRAGALDRRIILEQATEARDEATGEITRTWVPAYTVWAERLQRTPRERFLAAQPIAETEQGWRIRWRQTIAEAVTPDETWRVLDGGRVFDVTGVIEVGRREGLDIYGKARAE